MDAPEFILLTLERNNGIVKMALEGLTDDDLVTRPNEGHPTRVRNLLKLETHCFLVSLEKQFNRGEIPRYARNDTDRCSASPKKTFSATC